MDSGLASSLEASFASTVSLPEEDAEEIEEYDHQLRIFPIKNSDVLNYIEGSLGQDAFRSRLTQQLRGLFPPTMEAMVDGGMEYLFRADFVRDHGFNEPNRPVFRNSPLFHCLFDAVTPRIQGCSLSAINSRVNRWIHSSNIVD